MALLAQHLGRLSTVSAAASAAGHPPTECLAALVAAACQACAACCALACQLRLPRNDAFRVAAASGTLHHAGVDSLQWCTANVLRSAPGVEHWRSTALHKLLLAGMCEGMACLTELLAMQPQLAPACAATGAAPAQLKLCLAAMSQAANLECYATEKGGHALIVPQNPLAGPPHAA